MHASLMDAMIRRTEGLLPDEIELFNREGYLVVEDLFSDDDLSPIIAEVAVEIERRAPRGSCPLTSEIWTLNIGSQRSPRKPTG